MLPDWLHVLADITKDSRLPATRVTPIDARHFGWFWAALTGSILTVTVAGLGISMTLASKEPRWVGWAEVAVIIATLITAWQILRRVYHPYVISAETWQPDWHAGLQADNADVPIKSIAGKLTREAFLLTGLGLIPPLTFICCPAAIVQASRALDLITNYGEPIRTRRWLKIARVIASFTLSLYGCAVAFTLLVVDRIPPTIPPPIILSP